MNHQKLHGLPKPTKQKALVMYLLFERGKKGMTVLEAIKDCMFYKFSARVCDLINKDEVPIDKKQEKFTNRFGHKGMITRYSLDNKDLKKNIEIYNKLNSKK